MMRGLRERARLGDLSPNDRRVIAALIAAEQERAGRENPEHEKLEALRLRVTAPLGEERVAPFEYGPARFAKLMEGHYAGPPRDPFPYTAADDDGPFVVPEDRRRW